MDLTKDAILGLLRLSDPVGIISIYAETTPERQVHTPPEWALVIKNELRELRNRVKEEGPRDRWVALNERLDGLEGELEWLADPKESGRGRALFAPVSLESVERVQIQLPLPDRVVFAETAFVRPLVSALDEGRAAGIAVVDRSGVRVLEWRFGEATELGSYDFFEPTSEWRRMKGPAPSSPTVTGQHAAPQHDLFQERFDEHVVKFLRTTGDEISNQVAERGWDRLVVGAESRFADPFVEAVGKQNNLDIQRTDQELRFMSPAEVGEAIHPIVQTSQRSREAALVELALERALGGGHGSAGLAETLGALVEGRIQHLLYDDRVEHQGYRAPDGRLLPPDAGEEGSDLVREPYLVERMVERAFETGAEVTPVDDDAADRLAEHDGVAAILRW